MTSETKILAICARTLADAHEGYGIITGCNELSGYNKYLFALVIFKCKHCEGMLSTKLEQNNNPTRRNIKLVIGNGKNSYIILCL